ncbi:MAG TPA: ATP-dependent DNA ligase [Tepidisphaeraceae bacterium]|jgi:DNA ligase-1
MCSSLREFAEVNDQVAATTKKLQKQSILAAYFRSLDEENLRLAVRYAGGRNFPATDERVLGVGWSIVNDVVLTLIGMDPERFHDLVVRSGETGEALSMVWKAGMRGEDGLQGGDGEALSALALTEVSSAFDGLANTNSGAAKRDVLMRLFARCDEPREAAYLAKILFRELRNGVREGVLQAAVAQAFEKPLSAIQRCQLLVGDLDEVAVLAKRNAIETASFRLFHPIQFMLATPMETAELAGEALGGRMYYAEDKLDGIRAQVHKSADRIAIYTRTMDRTDESFPDVVSALASLPGEFLLDGEIVPYRDGQVLPFAHIQRRLGRKTLSRRMLLENPAAFIAFDILYLNGTLLMDEPLEVRRNSLRDLAASGGGTLPRILMPQICDVTQASEIAAAFEASRSRRNEGIILKDPQSAYSPGRRGQWWLKLKTHLPTFDCVVTAAEFGHGKRRDVLSDYTFAVWDRDPSLPGAELVNVGKAYSGLTDAEIAQLTALFHSIAIARAGRVFAVKPQIVLEIACDQIQKSARHASGYALRFPRIKRIRWDKPPDQADRVARIEEIYESSPNFARTQFQINSPPPMPTLFD